MPLKSRKSTPYQSQEATTQVVEMENLIPAASIEAWRQLMALNFRSDTPEAMEWLHSEAAEPVLQQLLVNVPCSLTLH
jgi:hypothetical protein